ncbi:PDR/VanB family oxidoreductase [Streptomyces hokutonensis]|uniref:PDR/VanB family oxidoreductase n=1 Tax=Streptomyces hokutonensis TaxID=1306990 RepID=UPI00036C5972|nr:PDR/VanB family oxidoreductase [Streptomyces hokutonensis]
MKTLDVIVHAISPAGTTGTSRSYELRAAAGSTLSSFEAGAHNDVHLGPSLVRRYSLCNSPQDKGRYLIRVRRDDAGRGGSRALHRDLTVGGRLRISPPRNHFPLVAAERHVLVAGGIVTPLLSTAEAPAARGASFVLHHYTSGAAGAPLLERLRTSAFAERTGIHHSDQGDSVRAGLPAEPLVPEADTAVHVCGPDGSMTHVVTEATAAGRQPGQLHTERFAPAAPPAAGDEGATEFTVRIARTGIGYPVPADCTIADGLTAPGVEVELSCEQGICDACPTPGLDGEPDHRDEVQTPDERAAGDRITICCSRARTPELLLGL